MCIVTLDVHSRTSDSVPPGVDKLTRLFIRLGDPSRGVHHGASDDADPGKKRPRLGDLPDESAQETAVRVRHVSSFVWFACVRACVFDEGRRCAFE